MQQHLLNEFDYKSNHIVELSPEELANQLHIKREIKRQINICKLIAIKITIISIIYGTDLFL